MKKMTQLFGLVALVVYFIFLVLDRTVASDSDSVMDVTAQVVRREEHAYSHIFGAVITASDEAIVSAQVAGTVVFADIQEGSRVQKGQLIARINSDEYIAQHQQSIISLQIAEEQEKKARRAWDDLKPEDRAQYVLESEKMRSVVAESNAIMQKTRITAPFDGVLSAKFVSDGSTVHAGSLIVRVVGDLKKREIACDVPSEIGAAVNVGDSVRLVRENATFDAIVYSVDPVADTQTRKMTVRATLDDRASFTVGDFVDVHIESDSGFGGFAIPAQSIVRFYDDAFVFVIIDDHVQLQRIHILTAKNGMVIVDGIEDGSQIVTSSAHFLREGDRVRSMSL